MDIEKTLRSQYQTLGHKEGEITELRTLPGAKSYFCSSEKEFVDTASNLLSENLYVGLNPRKTKEPGKVNSIARLTCLCVDIDPVRPKDTGSTDEQLKASIGLATRISEELNAGTVVSSGSGAHLYLPIQPLDIRNAEILSESLKKWCTALRANYETKELRIDPIFDLPRIIRVWSSFNHKSKRICQPIGEVINITRQAYEFNQEPVQKVNAVSSGSETEQRFHRLCKTNKRLKELVDGAIAFPSRSECDASFVTILNNSQFSIPEIASLLKYNTNGQSKKGDKEIVKDIERIIKSFGASVDAKSFSLVNNFNSYFSSLPSRRMGIRTGFNTLDEMISGLKDGKLYIFGARPTTGKTTIMTQILVNIAEQGIPCLFFPTEVGAEPIIDKIISRKLKLGLKKFQNGTFTEKEVQAIEETKPYIASLPLTIYEDFGLNVEEFERQLDKYAPKVVCLDYFQALKWDDPASVGEKENAVRRIKKITKDRNIVTVVMSQLNRNSNQKVSMSELKGTGALEEYADVITQMYKVDAPLAYPVPIDLIVTKSKYSATGPISMKFWNTWCEFKEDDNNEQVSNAK